MIRLPWPPTVNHYYTVARGRKILSTRGRKYGKQAALEIIAQGAPCFKDSEVSVVIRAYPPDKRKRDIDNIIKPILDVLSGPVFDDDCQVSDLRITRYNPRKGGEVEILVYGQET
jgi:crossover junction endodeoxyribonuclease RusA